MVERLKAAYANWMEDGIPQTAAALSYYTVVSIAPLILIAAGIAGIVFGRESAREQIVSQMQAVIGPQGGAALQQLLGRPDQAEENGILSAVVGFVTLLVGAVGVLAQLKAALNKVWDVPTPAAPSWGDLARQYLGQFALVLATGFLLLVSLLATAAIGVLTATLKWYLAGPDVLWVAFDFLVGLGVATLLFALIFKTVPDADTRWRDVWGGALFTALLFTLGRLALGWYLGRNTDSAYGAAGSILALLLWVYYSSQLVLFGAEYTFVASRPARARKG
jgi:membrane protein